MIQMKTIITTSPILNWAFVLLLFTNSSKLNAQCIANSAINVSRTNDLNSEWPFANIFKNANEWKTAFVTDNLSAPSNTNQLSSASKDVNGYVKKIPFGTSNNVIVYSEFDNVNSLPLGTYTLLFDGSGSVTVNGAFEVLSTNGNTINLRINRANGNIGRVIITSSSETNNIRNIRLLLPGTQNSYQANPWNPTWSGRISAFKVIRFSKWISQDINTNFVWTNRPTNDYFSYNLNGVPYELMVRYCNDFNKDAWINIPHNATDNFVRSLAQYLKNNLNISSNVYVELSNELYDETQPQSIYLKNALGSSIPWPGRLATRINAVMDIFTQEFSGQTNRLFRVLGSDLNNTAFVSSILTHIPSGKVDVLACDVTLQTSGIVNTSNPNEIIENIENTFDNTTSSKVSAQINIASNANLDLHLSNVRLDLSNITPTVINNILANQEFDDLINTTIQKVHDLNNNQAFVFAFSNIFNQQNSQSNVGLMQNQNTNSPFDVNAPGYHALQQNNVQCVLTGSENLNPLTSVISIYPNPARNTFKLSLPLTESVKSASVVITNADGKKVWSKSNIIANETEVELNVSSGVYFVNTTLSGNTKTDKLVIMN